MEAFNKYLQQFPDYKPSVFDNVVPFLNERILLPEEFFLQHGQVSRNIAFIQEGLIRLYYINDQGKEVTNCFCKENSITSSYQSLITQKESEMNIQAIEECKLIVLSYDSLQKLFSLDPFWQQLGRLAAESEYVVSQRHNRFLKDLSATERYMQVLKHEGELLHRVPLNILASYLQISPETLSRIRKRISRT